MKITYNNCLDHWKFDEKSGIKCLSSLDALTYDNDKNLKLLAHVVDIYGVYKLNALKKRNFFTKGFKTPKNKFKYITKKKSRKPDLLTNKQNMTKKCRSELKRLGSKLESSESLLCVFNDGIKKGLYEVEEVKKIRNSNNLKVIFMDGEEIKINKDEKTFAYIDSFKLNQLQQIDPNTGIRDPIRKKDHKMMLSLDDFNLQTYDDF